MRITTCLIGIAARSASVRGRVSVVSAPAANAQAARRAAKDCSVTLLPAVLWPVRTVPPTTSSGGIWQPSVTRPGGRDGGNRCRDPERALERSAHCRPVIWVPAAVIRYRKEGTSREQQDEESDRSHWARETWSPTLAVLAIKWSSMATSRRWRSTGGRFDVPQVRSRGVGPRWLTWVKPRRTSATRGESYATDEVPSRHPRIRSRPEKSRKSSPHAAFCPHKNTNGHPIQTGLGNFTQKISEEQTASDRFTRIIYQLTLDVAIVFSEFVIPMGLARLGPERSPAPPSIQSTDSSPKDIAPELRRASRARRTIDSERHPPSCPRPPPRRSGRKRRST